MVNGLMAKEESAIKMFYKNLASLAPSRGKHETFIYFLFLKVHILPERTV